MGDPLVEIVPSEGKVYPQMVVRGVLGQDRDLGLDLDHVLAQEKTITGPSERAASARLEPHRKKGDSAA